MCLNRSLSVLIASDLPAKPTDQAVAQNRGSNVDEETRTTKGFAPVVTNELLAALVTGQAP
jgi:hypothetical protein